MKQYISKYYPFIPLILVCTFYAFKAISFPIHDFANYYFGSKFLVDGNFNSTIYFPYEFNNSIANLGFKNIFASYAPNTPFLAVFFFPFTFTSVLKAKIIFNCISIILLLVSINRLFNYYKIDFRYLIFIPILFFFPIKNNLLFGQVYFFILFLLSEALIAYEKEQFKKMSVFLSLAILLKVFPVLLFLIFIFKTQFRPFIYLIISCLLLFIISLFFTGVDIWVFYIQNVLSKASNGEIANSFVTNYQSIFMFLKEFLVFDATENSNAIFNNPTLFLNLVLVFKLVLITIGFYITRKTANTLFVFSYCFFIIILISPYGSTYGLILLLFPFISVLKHSYSNIKKVFFSILFFLINTIPLSYYIKNEFPFSYIRLFILITLFMVFINLYYKKINWKIVTFISIIPILLLPVFKKSKTINSYYFLDKNAPILIFDYKIGNNNLSYFYWNEKGENSRSIPIKVRGTKALTIINNQVYHNKKQLTFDKSNKIKPILIDNKTLLYLSDYDRGIGFYTLRKTDLN